VIVGSRDRTKPSPRAVVAKTNEVKSVPVVMDAGVPIDAAVVEARPDAGLATKPEKPRANPELAKLLADAEAAARAGNRLRQMALADSALRIDPRNVRAKLLLADALIATGDHDRGCKYLQELGRNPTAIARAKQAGCVGN
jgi:thioredoxin-like negative regulator of GroEL